MSRLPFLLFGLLGTALTAAIVIGLESTNGRGMALPQAAPRMAAIGGPAPARLGRTPQTSAWTAAVLARPLFDPDRRPPTLGTVAQPADAALPRLTGTMVTAAGRRAIFAGSGPPLVVEEGARVGAFTLMLIAPGEVTLRGPGGLRTIRPSFDPSRPAAPQVAGPLVAVPTPPGPQSPGRPGQPPVTERPPADPLTGRLSIGPSPAADGTAEGAVPFEQRTTPSGLDILRNNSRDALPPGSGAVQ